MGRKRWPGRAAEQALGGDRDVVIIGGGPAGSAAGIALARTGFRVAVLNCERAEGDELGKTLPAHAKGLLEHLRVWDAFQAAGYPQSSGAVAAWGQSEATEMDFGLDPSGPGWQVECGAFDGMMLEAATRAGAGVGRDVRVDACEREADGRWRVAGESAGKPVEIRAAWVIDASGRSACLARRQGAERRPDDRLVAVIARDLIWKSQDPRELLEARPGGWWRASRTADGQASAFFMTDADLLPYGQEALVAHWTDELKNTVLTREIIEQPSAPASLHTVAANSSRLSRVLGTSWMAVGDAAATHDSLSSSGIFEALKSGVWAAEALAEYRAGDPGALDRFAESSHAEYQQYHRANAALYALEQRWPNSAFWKRRHRFTNAGGSYEWNVFDTARPAPSQSARGMSSTA